MDAKRPTIIASMEICPAYVAVSLERFSDMGLKPKLVPSTENSGSSSESRRKTREPQASVPP